MPLKVLIDMNLAPSWVKAFSAEGWQAVHWSSVGDPRAPDAEIMGWAKAQGYLVFTHDLDFSAILAANSG